MTEPPNRLRKLAWALAPVWVSRFDDWQARRRRERQRMQRQLERLANPPSAPIEPERRELLKIDAVFRRQRPYRPEEAGWRSYADAVRREQKAYWDDQMRERHPTRAVDNFMSRYR
jgi:hypothetical protein